MMKKFTGKVVLWLLAGLMLCALCGCQSSESSSAQSQPVLPKAEPVESGDKLDEGIPAQVLDMRPLILAHTLAQNGGMVYDAQDPSYVWMVLKYAVETGKETLAPTEEGKKLILSKDSTQKLCATLFSGISELPPVPEYMGELVRLEESSQTYSFVQGGVDYGVALFQFEEKDGEMKVFAALVDGGSGKSEIAFSVSLQKGENQELFPLTLGVIEPTVTES